MTKHTPGPWAMSNAPYGALRVGPALLEHPGREAVEYAQTRGRDLLAQRAADAALIAAAPDMLQALRDIAATSTGYDSEEIIAEIQGICARIIAQAKGGAV